MTLHQILSELVRSYWKEHIGLDDFGCEECEKYIAHAQEEIMKLLPENKATGLGGDYNKGWFTGYNQAIQEMKEKLK